MDNLRLLNMCLFFQLAVLRIVKHVQQDQIVFYVSNLIFCNSLSVWQLVMLDFINTKDTVFLNVHQILLPSNHHINVKHAYHLALHAVHKLSVFLVLMAIFCKGKIA